MLPTYAPGFSRTGNYLSVNESARIKSVPKNNTSPDRVSRKAESSNVFKGRSFFGTAHGLERDEQRKVEQLFTGLPSLQLGYRTDSILDFIRSNPVFE